MFIDEVNIKVISGKWWNWIVSWRREKYIPKWGPWGWDGWRGWDVFLQTTTNLNTLSEYRHKKVLRAQDWEDWGTNTKHGANGEDIFIMVPVWTIVRDLDSWEILADLSEDNTRLLVAIGWKWGFWNAHFCSSTRQAPSFAELWDIAIEKNLWLELKLVADIWIIWIPSAWKSSFIWTVTNVKPKIWDYPFTTLIPNLGVLDHKWKSLVLEDVPGLIPGASSGKWLWIEFLKHIERTWVLLHLLDLYRLDKVFSDYSDIRNELAIFNPDLLEKDEVVVFSKADLLDDEMKEFIVSEFKAKYPEKIVFVISSATWEDISNLIDFLIDSYGKNDEVKKLDDKLDTEDNIKNLTIFDLKNNHDSKAVEVDYLWDFVFEAKWARLEQIIRMTDFTNPEALLRAYDVMDKFWVIKIVEAKLEKITQKEEIDNSFFFEWNDDAVEFSPKIIIAGKQIDLDKLRYNLD